MKTILLVEDDPFLIDIYTTKLEQAGFSVEVAQDGKIALEKLKKENPKERKNVWPDVLVLDILLPHISGWQVLEEAKEKIGLKDLKVVVLSNLGEKKEIEKASELGVEKYLIKANYTPEEVVEEIKKVIEKYS